MAIYVESCEVNEENVVRMLSMQPCQAGIVLEGEHKGHIVIRTQSVEHFEVMDFTDPFPNACWEGHPAVKVELLKKPVIIKIDGKLAADAGGVEE